jgi:hypothetical protein
LGTALVHARQAQELARSRPGYSTLVAEILHALGRDNEAAGLARFVAERWLGLHVDEAVSLWEKLPPSARTGSPLVPSPPVAGMRTITGKVTSLTCDSKGETMTVALDGNPITLTVPENIVTVFSDTLWYGRDHSSLCHHLDGLQAVIDYNPSSNPGMTGRFFMHREIPVTSTSR